MSTTIAIENIPVEDEVVVRMPRSAWQKVINSIDYHASDRDADAEKVILAVKAPIVEALEDPDARCEYLIEQIAISEFIDKAVSQHHEFMKQHGFLSCNCFRGLLAQLLIEENIFIGYNTMDKLVHVENERRDKEREELARQQAPSNQ